MSYLTLCILLYNSISRKTNVRGGGVVLKRSITSSNDKLPISSPFNFNNIMPCLIISPRFCAGLCNLGKPFTIVRPFPIFLNVIPNAPCPNVTSHHFNGSGAFFLLAWPLRPRCEPRVWEPTRRYHGEYLPREIR